MAEMDLAVESQQGASIQATITDGVAYSPDAESTVIDVDMAPTTSQKLVDAILDDVSQSLEATGGPSQYLEGVDHEAFCKWLWDTFAEDDRVIYHHEALLPPVPEADLAATPPLVVHCAALGFSPICSMKPPCGVRHCLDMVEQYLLQGFVTSGIDPGPLVVTEVMSPVQDWPSPWKDLVAKDKPSLKPFSLAYVKGMARASSLLMLLHRLKVMQVEIRTELPHLFDTVCKIHIHHLKSQSRLEECLTNMRISCSGSLRKATNTLQAVVMVKNLMKMGSLQDYMSFVKKWNTMSTRQFQFPGKKLSSMRLLFESAPQALFFWPSGLPAWLCRVWSDLYMIIAVL